MCGNMQNSVDLPHRWTQVPTGKNPGDPNLPPHFCSNYCFSASFGVQRVLENDSFFATNWRKFTVVKETSGLAVVLTSPRHPGGSSAPPSWCPLPPALPGSFRVPDLSSSHTRPSHPVPGMLKRESNVVYMHVYLVRCTLYVLSSPLHTRL